MIINRPPGDREGEARRVRQRSRNRALGLVLAGLALLFFAITIVKLGVSHGS